MYHIIALLTAIIWGTTFISTKVLLRAGLHPEDILFYRFALAYAGIWFFCEKRLFAKTVRDEGLFVLLGIFGGSLYFLTENIALEHTLASNVSLLVSVAPLLTAILSHFFLKNEQISRNLITGSLVALAGVALVVFNGSFILQVNPLGDFLSISAALCWAVYTILLKRIENHYSTLFIIRKVFFYGILTILPVFAFNPLTTDTNILFQPTVTANLLYLGFIASLACYFLWNISLKHLGTMKTTNYIYFIPLVTLITSFLVLDERITWVALMGAGCILGGIFWAERRSRN